MTPELRAAITGYLDEGWAVVPRQGGRGGRARNPYPRSGPARGLLRRIQTREFRNAGRDLVGPVSGLTGAAGTCVWCGQEAEGRRRWHDPCARAYRIARGRQDVPVAPPEWCAGCGADIRQQGLCPELDHVLSLACAHEVRTRGRPDWWKAWTAANLRQLCRPCHLAKTQADNLQLASLRYGPAARFAWTGGPQGRLTDAPAGRAAWAGPGSRSGGARARPRASRATRWAA